MSILRRMAEAGPARVRQAAAYRFEHSDVLLHELHSLKSDFEARLLEVDQRMDSVERLLVDDRVSAPSSVAPGLAEASSSSSETFVEEPFVFAAVADLPPGSHILDLGGGAEWRVGSLAASGHFVTAVEAHPDGVVTIRHPKLTLWSEPLDELDPLELYDVVVLVGGATLSRPAPDRALIALVDRLTAESGRLVLTVSYRLRIEGDPWFDRSSLLDLLQGWTIRYVAVARRVDRSVWDLQATKLIDATEQEQLVMLVATRADASPAPEVEPAVAAT